ncbi:MAG TPA: PrsW family glutamic-type intramembrane protease [Oscillospiraceae bacterium]|nr:PrsW family glutamic-type intramembrane protease [Oscillospiraceae bacterium]
MLTRLIITAITPTIALAIGIYLTDRYDKEPWRLLLRIFLMGALSVIPVVIVQKLLLSVNIFPDLLFIAYTAFIVAGLTEEFFKRFVIIHGVYNDINFDEKLDGIVYSVFSALGFATVENIIYVVFRFSGNYYVGILRGLLSVPAHMLFGITMGYYLSLSKYTEEPKLKEYYYRMSLIIPAFLHGLFNFILMARIPILMIAFIPYVVYLWVNNLKKLNQYTRASRDKNDRIDDPEE